jgi:hypothetical protein
MPVWGHGILSRAHIVVIAAFRDEPEFVHVADALAALRRWRLWP